MKSLTWDVASYFLHLTLYCFTIFVKNSNTYTYICIWLWVCTESYWWWRMYIPSLTIIITYYVSLCVFCLYFAYYKNDKVVLIWSAQICHKVSGHTLWRLSMMTQKAPLTTMVIMKLRKRHCDALIYLRVPNSRLQCT